MKQQEFVDFLGESYQVKLPEGEVAEVILAETGDLPPPPENAPEIVRRDPFYLVFHGTGKDVLPADVLVVIDPNGIEYQLNFNAEGYVDDDPEKGLRYYIVIN